MDAFIYDITKIEPHPNADRLVVAHVMGYRCITATGMVNVGDKVVYIAPDAMIDVESPWLDQKIAQYLGKHGRVRNVRLRGLISEGLIFKADIFTDEQLAAIAEGRAADVGITHYSPPVKEPRNTALGNVAENVRRTELPFGLSKTDQENVQQIPRNLVVNKTYLVTKKMDGTSCTIAIKSSKKQLDDENFHLINKDGERWSFDIHIASRNLDLKIDHPDNVYVVTALPIATRLCEYIANTLQPESVVVARGEICGTGINKSAPNADADGDPVFHLFEFFFLSENGIRRLNIFEVFPLIASTVGKVCREFQKVTLTEENYDEVINEYLDAPAEKYGEGVVFWEVDTTSPANTLMTGFSFKAKSRDYYAQL